MTTLLPDTMRAIEITDFGGPDVLQLVSRPRPTPASGEVLIKVAAAGVNRPDLVQRQGLYPAPSGASDLPGLEVSGEIVAIDNNATLNIGDRVCALLAGGGYAEYAVADETHCLPIPNDFTVAQAAALPETFFTVWHNLFQRARLACEESLLVHGGTSGIGTTAIQLGKAFGAKVFATAGSDAKCEACLTLGADQAINYRNEDFVDRVKQETGGKGVDVILDMVGGDYMQRNMKAAALDGRILTIAFLKGAKAELNMMPLLIKRLSLLGSTLRAQSNERKAQIAGELTQQVWPLLDSGETQPVIDSIFSLEDAAQAHERMESGQHIGKIILEVSPP